MALVAVVLLAACGDSPDEERLPAATTASEEAGATEGTAIAGSGMDVSSGCWTAEQRVAPDASARHQRWDAPPANLIDAAKRYTARVETSAGAFEVELYPGEAPLAVNSFVCLARAGYYDGVVFHRILPGFVVQGGDPTGTGRGGPGYRFADEPVTRPYEVGTLAMANSGPDTNGSQFFVVLEGGGARLSPDYTVFGRVTSGMDVVAGMAGAAIEPPTPSPYRIQTVTITEA